MIPPVKSQVYTTTSQGGKFVAQDFLDRVGPNGRRAVIERLWIHCSAQVDVVTTAIAGEDLARIFGQIVVEQVDGVKRYNLAGDMARVWGFFANGPDSQHEYADTAVAVNQAFQLALCLPLNKPFMHTPEDTSLPVDMFRKVELTLPQTSVLGVAGGTITLDTASYWVTADLREDFDVQIYGTDVVESQDFTSLSEATISVGGKLHDVILHAAGANGGASLANLTEGRIDKLGVSSMTRQELLAFYRRSRGVAANLNSTQGGELRSDPFTAGAAVPLLMSHQGTSHWDGKVVDAAKINLTNSVASLRAITRKVVPTSEHIRNATASAYGKRVSDFRAATASKTMRDPGRWPRDIRPFLRLKASWDNKAA